MKIAVLMSTYNGEKYLQEQIDSILAQRGDFQLDLWVRDDGSIDRTRVILQDYETKGKLKWYAGETLGPAKSFVDLIKHCPDYDFYSFADQDDYWFKNKVQAAIEDLADKTGLQVYFADAEIVDAQLNTLRRTVYKSYPCIDFETLCCAGGILGCTMIFNAELAKAVYSKLLPTQMVMHDYYIAELCLALGGNMTFDPCVRMKYRQHDNNVIGLPHGKLSTIKNRVREITRKYKVSIADQAQVILDLYGTDIENINVEWLKRVALYRSSLAKRFLIASTRKTKYANINVAVTIRLSLLLGNR